MPLTLTQAEIDALLKERQRLINTIPQRQQSVLDQDQVIADATNADNAQKKLFDFYHTNIITQYENEREALNSEYIIAPVSTADLDACGALDGSNRMYPPIGQSDLVRITEFDDGGKDTSANLIPVASFPAIEAGDLNNEPFWISHQSEVEDWLVNGFGGLTTTATSFILGTGIDDTATTMAGTVTTGEEFFPGETFVLKDGSNQIGIKVLSMISSTPNVGVDDVVVSIVVLTPGDVSIGAEVDEVWAGFSNADRTAKVDSTNGYTYMLNKMIDMVEDITNNRISLLDIQLTAHGLNEDPGFDITSTTNANTSKTFLLNWQSTKNVDDATLATLSTERGVRNAQLTARISTINSQMATFYTPRYNAGNDVGNTSRGTSRIRIFRQGAKTQIQNILAAEQNRLVAIEDLLTFAGVPF